jgi:hypothetical protein
MYLNDIPEKATKVAKCLCGCCLVSLCLFRADQGEYIACGDEIRVIEEQEPLQDVWRTVTASQRIHVGTGNLHVHCWADFVGRIFVQDSSFIDKKSQYLTITAILKQIQAILSATHSLSLLTDLLHLLQLWRSSALLNYPDVPDDVDSWNASNDYFHTNSQPSTLPLPNVGRGKSWKRKAMIIVPGPEEVEEVTKSTYIQDEPPPVPPKDNTQPRKVLRRMGCVFLEFNNVGLAPFSPALTSARSEHYDKPQEAVGFKSRFSDMTGDHQTLL